MSDQFRAQLDGLIAQARADLQQEHDVIARLASALYRYSTAKEEILRIGAAIGTIGQPLTSQSPPPAPFANEHRAQLAEAAIADEWAQYRQEANGSWPPKG